MKKQTKSRPRRLDRAGEREDSVGDEDVTSEREIEKGSQTKEASETEREEGREDVELVRLARSNFTHIPMMITPSRGDIVDSMRTFGRRTYESSLSRPRSA